MLFVTHDLGVVAKFCDDLCVIYAGQTVEAGPVNAVHQRRQPIPIRGRCSPATPSARQAIRRHPGQRAVACAPAARLPLRAALRRGGLPVAPPAAAPASSGRGTRWTASLRYRARR